MKKGDKETQTDFFISIDLIVEILKKLPSKSLVRFRSVSKQWSIIICSHRDFIESIVTRSLAQSTPHKHPLFIFHHCVSEYLFEVSFVLSQSTKPDIKSAHRLITYQYARGLICCYSPESRFGTIYNPTTRQSFPLPKIKFFPISQYVRSYCYFGYDSIMNQYKVLNIIVDNWKQTCQVFTLEQGQSWRKIQNIDEKEKLSPTTKQICIDGIIYFVAHKIIITEDQKFVEILLLSFNIRSERFDRVWVPQTLLRALLKTSCGTMVNHLGKLGWICCTEEDTSLWVMDNAEKQEWSRIIFSLPPLSLLGGCMDKFSGVTSAGEIFMTPKGCSSDNSFYVYYYNMKQNSFRRVEIKCARPDNIKHPSYYSCVLAIYDHVENTMWL